MIVIKFYSDREKRLLGRYFCFYRKKHHISLLQVYNAGICGHATVQDIEKGVIKKNDDYYDGLLHFYHLKYLMNDEDLQILEDRFEALYQVCEQFQSEKIDKEINSLFEICFSHQEMMIYREVIEVLNYLKKYYLDSKYLTRDEVLRVIPYINLFESLGSLLLEVCEQSNIKKILDIKICNQLYPLAAEKDDAIGRYWYARECEMKVNYIKALEIYKDLLKYYEREDNVLRKTRTLMDIHSIYRDVDQEKGKIYTSKLEDIVKDERLPVSMKKSVYYNLGMYYYLYEDYEKALKYYERSNELMNDEKNILFICACKSRLNQIICFDYSICENHSLYPCLKYYQLCAEGVPPVQLQQFILKEVMKRLKQEIYAEPLWTMYEYEMSRLCKKTRSYRSYQIYILKMKENIKEG